ncbi:hypothetical protein GCM10009557_32330 [Virgisporangium ochraceum]|uniref:Uncharacterized protein n=1 Tax=Virgisporangium ochraceum TaxID=65505 RepID=A0A8J3ZYA8_9ACTN|nr:DUF6182 family protein [Virgisporangium ochraceum]GIJ70740.1 hypothetical protein Voc01_056570 [Virgisporangium ochraceum]
MPTQELLRAEWARRIRRVQVGPDAPAPDAPGPDAPGPPDVDAAERAAPDVAAIAVLRRFDPEVFVRSAVAFAAGVHGTRRDAWFRAFTRTIFLSGNPANLRGRFTGDHLCDDGSMMWFAPVPPDASLGLRRLLKRFDGGGEPVVPATLTTDLPGPASGTVHRLEIATAGLTVGDYLVHVNHVLAEAVLTRVIRPGDRLDLSHAPRIGHGGPPYSMLRVHHDTADHARLRAYVALSAGSRPAA